MDTAMSGADLIRENTEPLVNLEANELTQNLAAPFAQLQDELLASLAEENKLLLAIARAEARARRIDVQIDALVDALKHALLVITGGVTTAEPYVHFFKNQPPAAVKEPLLGEELDTVVAWLPSLAASTHESLQGIGKKLEPLVKAGWEAMKAMAEANQALVHFYEVGARRALIEKMNAARKLAYGQLGQVVHDHPELSLPTTFPDAFFLHDTRKRKKETPATIDVEIAALKKRIEGLEIRREKIAAILAAQDQATAKKKSAKTADAIDKAEKEHAQAAAKLAALRAEVEKP
ncbi:Hypothetical protein A7982_00395 [Minicystis rosea]|nr:Hypothetical protein A7982_00395 [Minicystis rosea]